MKETKEFITKNWLLILIAIFSFVAMVNSIESNHRAWQASDYAAGAYTNSLNANYYAERVWEELGSPFKK